MAEILKNGRGTLLAKLDIKQACRNIPVHPKDRHLLGMLWKGGGVCRHGPPLWAKISPPLVHGSSRCVAMASAGKRGYLCRWGST